MPTDLLRLESVCAGYGDAVVLDEVSMAIAEGESLALRDFADVVQAHLRLALGDELLALRLARNDSEPWFQRVKNAGLNEDAFRLFPALVG